jgi:hypothetical protein
MEVRGFEANRQETRLDRDGLGRFLLSRRNRIRLDIRRLLVARLANVDSALEKCAIFDRDALRDHVAGERSFAADIYAVTGVHITLDFAQDHDFPRRDICRNLSVAAHGDAITRQIDRAFYLAVDVEGLRTSDFALDDQALTDRGLVGCRLLGRRGARARGFKAGGGWRGRSNWLAGGWRRASGLIWFPHLLVFPFFSSISLPEGIAGVPRPLMAFLCRSVEHRT